MIGWVANLTRVVGEDVYPLERAEDVLDDLGAAVLVPITTPERGRPDG